MKIAHSWLREYISIQEDPESLGKKLTALGLEVEGIYLFEEIPSSLEGVLIGEVLTKTKHPGADKLSLTTVDVGTSEPLPIVCGAANVAAGQKVVVATVGATLYPNGGEPFAIKKAKIRGEVSMGMICAEDEIGLGSSHDGILVLDTDLPNGTPAAEYFEPFQEQVFEIGLTPNRADAASHWGVARDLKVLFNRELKRPNLEKFHVESHDLSIRVSVENSEACPRYTGISIQGVQVAPSPKWLQNRLRAIGLKPLNNVVDITNFVLHELGQPLHAFDADQIKGQEIRVKMLPRDTPFVTLDEVERKLHPQDLMICDGEDRGLCIAGVFGGLHSGVTENTRNVFLESAYFDPGYIRSTSQRHGLKTDASFRFERGTDPNMAIFALKRAALLIKEIAGGKIASEVVDVYPQPVAHFRFPVKYKNIDRLMGKVLERDFIKRTLKNLEIELFEETEQGFEVSVPPYRVDVKREADVIEEIARVYGYDQIEVGETMGAAYLANFPKNDPRKIQFQIKQLLAANGLSEMLNNSLTKPYYTETVEGFDPDKNVKMLNPLSEELSVMRQTLLFSGLETIAYNINRRQKDLKLFEFGKTYQMLAPRNSEENPLAKYDEQHHLAIFLTGGKQAESWLKPSENTAFHDLAQVVQKVLQKTDVRALTSKATEKSIFTYGLDYASEGKTIAHLGQVKPIITKLFQIDQPVFYADLDWEAILAQYQASVQVEEISRFPEVRRDLSLLLDSHVSFDAIYQLAYQTEKKLVKAINVFDVYEGENIEAGKKSYSLSFTLEDKTDTLKDKTIEKTMNKLMRAFEEELGAIIRK